MRAGEKVARSVIVAHKMESVVSDHRSNDGSGCDARVYDTVIGIRDWLPVTSPAVDGRALLASNPTTVECMDSYS